MYVELMRGFVKYGFFEEALNLYEEMNHRGMSGVGADMCRFYAIASKERSNPILQDLYGDIYSKLVKVRELNVLQQKSFGSGNEIAGTNIGDINRKLAIESYTKKREEEYIVGYYLRLYSIFEDMASPRLSFFLLKDLITLGISVNPVLHYLVRYHALSNNKFAEYWFGVMVKERVVMPHYSFGVYVTYLVKRKKWVKVRELVDTWISQGNKHNQLTMGSLLGTAQYNYDRFISLMEDFKGKRWGGHVYAKIIWFFGRRGEYTQAYKYWDEYMTNIQNNKTLEQQRDTDCKLDDFEMDEGVPMIAVIKAVLNTSIREDNQVMVKSIWSVVKKYNINESEVGEFESATVPDGLKVADYIQRVVRKTCVSTGDEIN